MQMAPKAAFFAPPKAIELVAAESPILVFVQQIEQRALRRRRLKVHCELFEMSLHVLNDPWVSRNRAQQLLQQAVEAVLLMVAVDDVCNYKVEHDNNHCEQTHTHMPCRVRAFVMRATFPYVWWWSRACRGKRFFAQENGNAKTAQKTVKNGKNGKKVSAAAPMT
jgi:hypothetical protein